MPGFLVRVAINVLGLWLATKIVTGMTIEEPGTVVAAGLLLGVVNAVIRPILIFLTLPVTVVSLGLFLLVINALMLWLVESLLSDFELTGFGAAFFGALVISLTGWVSSWFIGPKGDVKVMVVEARRD